MENWNYFNYFTEIEEHFWKKRGAHLLVSPLDWAIMETWQKAGVPLDAALKGIDRAFESYQRSRRGAGKPMKTLAYCTDAVLQAAEESLEAAAGANSASARPPAADPFSRDELRSYLTRNSGLLRKSSGRCSATQPAISAALAELASSLDALPVLLDDPGPLDLEDLERRLTVLDDKLHASLLSLSGEDLLLRMRREVDSQLSPFRRKMKPEQLALIERQYLQKRLLDEFQLPRLSLYYFT